MSLSTPYGQSSRVSKSCPKCTNNSDGDLSCFKCRKWFHAGCVNVASPLPNTWLCTECTTFHESLSIRSNQSISSKASKSSQAKTIRLQLQLLEEERQLSIARDKEFVNRKLQLLQQAEDIEDELTSKSSISIHEWLRGQPEVPTLENVATLSTIIDTVPICNASNVPTVNIGADDQLFITNKNTQPQASSLPTVIYSSSRIATSEYVPNKNNGRSTQLPLPIHTITTTHNNSIPRTTQKFLVNSNTSAAPTSTQNNTELHSTLKNNYFHNNFVSRETNFAPEAFHSTNIFSGNLQSSRIQTRNLSVEQIHARSSVPKELPIFTGNPEEWPLFHSTFEWSTEVCGLSDSENLIRLQRSLKGDALKAVQNILIHPSCVHTAISTLKFLFGQPERILHSIRTKIKFAPPVNTNKLESISNFAIQVKGFLATIEACGLTDELNNSSLLQELVDKLPPN